MTTESGLSGWLCGQFYEAYNADSDQDIGSGDGVTFRELSSLPLIKIGQETEGFEARLSISDFELIGLNGEPAQHFVLVHYELWQWCWTAWPPDRVKQVVMRLQARLKPVDAPDGRSWVGSVTARQYEAESRWDLVVKDRTSYLLLAPLMTLLPQEFRQSAEIGQLLASYDGQGLLEVMGDRPETWRVETLVVVDLPES